MDNNIMELVDKLNKRATELNSEREKAVWKRDQAKIELETALTEYNQKYGTNLTVAGIEGEYQSELTKVENQAKGVQELIEKIESGEGYEVPPTPSTSTTPNIEQRTVAPKQETVPSTPNPIQQPTTSLNPIQQPTTPNPFQFDFSRYNIERGYSE